MKDDVVLLRSYTEQRSESAFAELVRRHMGLVYSTALRRVGGDAQLAEDVAQKVFTDLARKAHIVMGRPSVSGWLYVSAHLASAAVVRAEQRRKRRETQAHLMEHNAPPVGPKENDESLRPLLEDVVVTLPETDRAAIALRFFEQKTYLEIGDALRVSEEAARKRVERALEKLRDLLHRRGVSSSAAALGVALGGFGGAIAPVDLTTRIVGSALNGAASAGGIGGGVMASLKIWAPVVAIVACGVFLLSAQRDSQDALRRELTRLERISQETATLRSDNQRLARAAAAAENLRRAQGELPALRAAVATPSGVQPPSSPIVALDANGTIRWDNNMVSLRQFLEQLESLAAQPDRGDSHITLRIGSNASSGAIGYVVEEARKAGVNLRVISDGPLSPSFKASWF